MSERANETYVVARTSMQNAIEEYIRAADLAGCGDRIQDELNDAFFEAGDKWKVIPNE